MAWTKKKHTKLEERNVTCCRQVFFQLLLLVQMADWEKLKHRGFIQNVANFVRGVGRSAESAFSYFGPTVLYTICNRMMARLMGSDKKGVRENDTLVDKQTRQLGVEPAIIFCYDNCQRGSKLLHQRGEHSSAFFKGTHQCCHKAIIFLNKAFDAIFSIFTQHDQAIPSPWGMPVFEVVDFENTSNFIMEYC